MNTAFFSVIFFLIGVYLLIPEIGKRLRCSVKVKGKVAHSFSKLNLDIFARGNVTLYYPVFEFDVNFNKVYAQYNKGSKYEDWFKIGDEFDLRYNPHNPTEIIVVHNIKELMIGLICIGIAVVFLVWGLVVDIL